MNLIDDARRLVADCPMATDRAGFGECYYCSAPNYDGDYLHANTYVEIAHKPDCPLLSMPKIVAVLDAAAIVAQAYDRETAATGLGLLGSPLLAAVDALAAALEG